MLSELHIENLGVIEQLALVLEPGFTALTGETGAGKTMLVEAIELLVGGRADASMVRYGAAEARVDGRFVGARGEVVLSRVIPVDGRSRAYVDGRPATAAALSTAAGHLVDLHGQHAHQSLLAVSSQRAALDGFAGVDLAPLREARARVTELDAAIAVLGGDERMRAREIDLLRYQLAELDAAGVEDADEDRRLEAIEEVLADAVAHRAAGGEAVTWLDGERTARDAIAAARRVLGERAPFRELASRLDGVLADLDDLVSELRAVVETVEEDPERLSVLRERRQLLRDLCRKYGADLAEVLQFRHDATKRLAELEGYEERVAALSAERREAEASAATAAAAVGATRRTSAPRLAAAVTAGIRQLSMPHAVIDVAVGGTDADPAGERVEFLLAADPGSPLLPLTRVASGGELARAMLALRLVLTIGGPAGDDRIDPGGVIETLVFDEVDAGIGGAAAVSVAAALADLAARHQVLVVTHLAQVAGRADHQVAVTKSVADGVTTATAQHLRGDRRLDELARMLAGSVTDTARAHARELLDHGSSGSAPAGDSPR